MQHHDRFIREEGTLKNINKIHNTEHRRYARDHGRGENPHVTLWSVILPCEWLSERRLD